MTTDRASAALVAVALWTTATVLSAAPSTDERLRRLEEIVAGPGFERLESSVTQFEAELRELRGQVELNGHTIEQMRARQRELYLDIDRRLGRLEAAGGLAPPASAPPAASPPATTEPPAPPGAGFVPVPAPAPALAPKPAASTPPVAPPSAGAPAATVAPGDAEREYQAAFGLLREGRYEEAVAALRAFLKRHPEGSYAANAQYWLGEASYVNRQFDVALVEFRKVIDQYGASAKAPDAFLKIGYIHYERQQWKEARTALTELMQRYPDSAAARLAGQRLERMKKEGH